MAALLHFAAPTSQTLFDIANLFRIAAVNFYSNAVGVEIDCITFLLLSLRILS